MNASLDPTHHTLPRPPLPTAAGWAWFLDVDGTLLEFAPDPAAVDVPMRLVDDLNALRDAADGALALVSGRSIADIDQLFRQPDWAVAGLHGLERRGNEGRIERHAAPDPQRWRAVEDGARALAKRLPGVRVEAKPPCIALHCREAPQHEPALARAAAALVGRLDGYQLQRGNRVYEFKPTGADKGSAVLTLLGEAPFRGRVPVYVGDDLTDEDGFAAVNARGGVSVRVGARTPSAARFTLRDVPAVRDWLHACLATRRSRA